MYVYSLCIWICIYITPVILLFHQNKRVYTGFLNMSQPALNHLLTPFPLPTAKSVIFIWSVLLYLTGIMSHIMNAPKAVVTEKTGQQTHCERSLCKRWINYFARHSSPEMTHFTVIISFFDLKTPLSTASQIPSLFTVGKGLLHSDAHESWKYRFDSKPGVSGRVIPSDVNSDLLHTQKFEITK